MIDVNQPDYTNTPASERRPSFSYTPRDYTTPTVSIITPYYNTGPVFLETARSIERMSFAHWEWVIVDDGSTDEESLAQLERLQAEEPRVRVLHQANSGPGAARNRAAREARGRYLLQLDSDDLMEPTFVEKALWFLETQPQFAACNSYQVDFGSENFFWPNDSFQHYEKNVEDNPLPSQAVIRREAYLQAGGYDESCTFSYEDWDFWLNLAEVGLWGFTIPEYLIWYRHQENSRMDKAQKDPVHDRDFFAWLQQKHQGLASRFPHPQWLPSIDMPHARIADEIPVQNALLKAPGTKRVLFIVHSLVIGGAEKLNLDLIQLLLRRGYECTIVTTVEDWEAPWKSLFTSLTPDVFCLHLFLNRGDYPRFLNYLIDSRQIDVVLTSHSELAYLLAPYLRAHHPNLPILDYNHAEIEWKDGGYPGMGVRLGSQLDLNLTCSDYLKRWMVARGADPDRVEVIHYGIDTDQWNPSHYDTLAVRQRLGIRADQPLVLFVGRIAEEKRPLLFARIIKDLAARHPDFLTLVVGTGPALPAMKAFVTDHKLEQHIRFLGALPSPQVRELMAASDILLLPSEREGLALVLYECMAMEIVPVAVAVGGQAELVTPECGYLVAKGDQEVEEYVEALLHLLRDPQRRRRMAERARQRVVEHFNVERMVDGFECAFQRARQLAEARSAEKADLGLARYIAYLAVEYTRIEEVAGVLWTQREKFFSEARMQPPAEVQVQPAQEAQMQPQQEAQIRPYVPLKRRLLPFGSRRHETYKRIRKGVGSVIHFATNPQGVDRKSTISKS